MIQISTATNPLGFHQESGSLQESTAVEDGDVSKKKSAGIFAKLLEGLSAKLKSNSLEGNSEAAISTGAKGLSSLNGAEKNTILVDQDNKKIKNIGFFDENGLQLGLPALSGQNLPYLEQEIAVKTGNSGLDGLFSDKKDLKTFTLKHFQQETKQSDGETTGVFAREGGNKGIPSELLAKQASLSEAWSSAAEKNKNQNRLAADSRLGLGTGETESSQSKLSLSKLGNGEKEVNQLSEARQRRGRSRPSIEVRDLRTGSELHAAGRDAEAARNFSFNAMRSSGMEIEIPLDLRIGKAGAGPIDKAANAGARSAFFEDALAREFRGSLPADIVRSAAVIVRDGGEGTIRLTLNPPSLGDVKIRLQMTENKITGFIIVQSDEALRALERELPVLQKAFKDSGFSETSLDLSLESDNSADGWNFTAGENEQKEDFLSQMMAASRYETETELNEASLEASAPDPTGTALSGLTGRKPVNLLV